MDTLTKLLEISSRLDHIEHAGEWIARETVHTDNTICQTATLVSVIADDLRERIYELTKALEEQQVVINADDYEKIH